MNKIKQIYKQAFLENGDSASSVCWPKGRQDLRFQRLLANFPDNEGSLLDFGSGLAHLKEYLDLKQSSFDYYGVDLMEEFVEHSRKKYNSISDHFYSLHDFNSLNVSYDYIVCSGTFNIKYSNNIIENDQQFKSQVSQLFTKTKKCLSLNLMTTEVDYTQPDAWHVDPSDFIKFVSTNLSKRFSLDHSYMPYEYTVTIFKEDEILRPSNIFKIL